MTHSPKTEIEDRLGATFRSISHQKDAKVHVKKHVQGNHVTAKEIDLMLPELPIPAPLWQKTRGLVDLQALYFRYHDEKLHHKYQPHDIQLSDIFDQAEAMRLCLLPEKRMPGLTHNVEQRLFETLAAHNIHHQTESADEKPPYGVLVPLLIHQQLRKTALPSLLQEVMEHKDTKKLKKQLASFLEDIPEVIEDQAAFAHIITKMIHQIFDDEIPANGELSAEKEAESGSSEKEQEQEQEEETSEQQKKQASDSEENDLQDKIKQQTDALASFEEEVDEAEEKETESHLRPNHTDDTFSVMPYYAYTKEFDQVLQAKNLVTPQELVRLRHQLDQRLENLPAIARKHVNQFVKKVMATFYRRWQRDQEEGILDAGKLSRVIANPGYSQHYKIEEEHIYTNTVVTLLLDNSGSMRGRPITVAAMSAELLAQALESCGIRVEILGFTTAEWKGGKSRKKWQQEDSPKNPGRLNDLRHIIYKNADTPWRQARKSLGIMLKEGILKENIDGEAILWACERLAMRPEKRRILMVISDGAPVDDSTISANTTSYLDAHLKSVIRMIEQKSMIELLAIGIGHDVTRYYSHAVTLKDVEALSKTMFSELSLLLEA